MSHCSKLAASAAALAACAGLAHAQSFVEGFESPAAPGLAVDWVQINNSSPLGTFTWRHGVEANAFPPNNGGQYAIVSYNSGASVATISNWLLTPVLATINNGDTFSFYARSPDAGYPDRLQVRLSTAGASTNVGSSPTDLGDFTTLLLDINPTYQAGVFPDLWVLHTATVSGLGGPTSGRFAFRYFVENSGPSGTNGDVVGLDDVAYVSVSDVQGACCFPSGACTMSLAIVCAGTGGTYSGDGVTCVQANCPQPASGACCNVDGTCTVVTGGACAGVSGIYGGDGSACSGNCTSSYSYVGGAAFIPDGLAAGVCGQAVFVDITVGDSFTISAADASFMITHGWQGDVKVSLTHVDTGTTVVLVDQPDVPQTTYGFSTDNYGSGTVPFRSADAGAAVYDNAPNGSVAAPGLLNVTGVWKPESPLAAFVGENSAGTWRLVAEDCADAFTGSVTSFVLNLKSAGAPPVTCYPNCDGSTAVPFLNVADFTCFLQKFAASEVYANCDGSTNVPTLNVADFTCFLQSFAAGCSAP